MIKQTKEEEEIMDEIEEITRSRIKARINSKKRRKQREADYLEETERSYWDSVSDSITQGN